MDLSMSNRVVLALLVICGAMLVTPALGGTPLGIASWGSDQYGQVSQTPAGTGFTVVAAGHSHNLALQSPAPAPVVNFTANATSGRAPLAVQFTDSSIGSPTSWAWDFGDGGTSTETDPAHTYVAAGTYTVTLTVTNATGGSDTETKTAYIAVWRPPATPVCTQAPPPTADFSANRTSGSAPIAVQFTDTSTWSDPEPCTFGMWAWNFGDGTTVTGVRNPIHTYTAAGTYAVNLTVTNSGGTDTETKAGYIAVTVPPAPAIEVTVEVSGDFGNTWQAADDAPGPYLEHLPMVPQYRYTIANTGDVPLLSCAIAGVATFGPLNPGMSRTEQRTYAWAAGQQSVEATATGTYDGQAVSDTDRAYYFGAAPAIAIEVLTNGEGADAPPGPTIAAGSPVAWTYNVTNTGNVALGNVTVTDDQIGPVTMPESSLQPGQSMNGTATGTAVAGQHANNGTATGTPPGGPREVTASDPSYYFGLAPRAANFTWTPAVPRAGEEVRFTDTSTGDPEWWEWSFGDGATSIVQDPIHAFAAPGNYTVRLTAYFPGSEIGRDAVRTVNVSAPPVGGDTAFFLVSTTPAGAEVFLRDIGGGLHLAGNTSSGPLNVTVYLTGTPVTAIVANLTGYVDAVFPIASYPPAGQTVPVNLTLAPAVLAVPPSVLIPTDTNGDGICDDVNGNGRKDFSDVVLYFSQMSWIAANEPVAAFDCNGNGRIDFADVVWLFNHL